MKFIRMWDSTTKKSAGLQIKKGLKIDGREIQAMADEVMVTVDSVSGITLKLNSISDQFLQQIVTANKVAGSAVELQSVSAGGLYNNGGLGLKINGDMFSFDSTSGLMFDYRASDFQFIPGIGFTLSNSVVLVDGSRPFTAPQAGIDAVNANHLTTKGQVESMISSAITGDFSEVLINLNGQSVFRGQIGYVESVSGSFKLGKADSPSTAIAEYICSASTSIADGASGSFQNPSTEIDNIDSYVSGAAFGEELVLSPDDAGLPMPVSLFAGVSGTTYLPVGWKVKSGKMVFFPKESLDL